MRKTVVFVLMTAMILSMAAPALAGWRDELSRTEVPKVIDREHPSYLDLDEVDYSIDYPDDEDYLDDFIVKYIKASEGHSSVYALHGLNDGAEWKEMSRKVYNNTRIVVLAEHTFKQDGVKKTYCCGIYEDDGNVYAGWIQKKYLVNKPSTD